MRYRIGNLLLALAAACGGSSAPAPQPVESVLRSASGDDVGRVTLREMGDRIQIQIRVSGLPGGTHGMHVHSVGLCEGSSFASAGEHLNPGRQARHGRLNPQGPHLGDLGNLVIGNDGRAEATLYLSGPEARGGLRTVLGSQGVALVIHEQQDDERTDPAGNSGARIACASIS